jgi:hypothetical protein
MHQCHAAPNCSNEVTQVVPDTSTKKGDEGKGIITYNHNEVPVPRVMTKLPFTSWKLGLHDDIGPPL